MFVYDIEHHCGCIKTHRFYGKKNSKMHRIVISQQLYYVCDDCDKRDDVDNSRKPSFKKIGLSKERRIQEILKAEIKKEI